MVICFAALVDAVTWEINSHDLEKGTEAFLITLGAAPAFFYVAIVLTALYQGCRAAFMSVGMQKVARWLLRPWPFGILVFLVFEIIVARRLPPATCRDGWGSPSIGLRGACSHHGGVAHGWHDLALIVCAVLGLVAGMWRRARHK
jgi:hypothetical protein